ncbi:MAG: ankyrin repeat domain-containing protein [Limnobacter sp.]|nr:ankyrin repeat domain-containing protein [Limnobacter sp.]
MVRAALKGAFRPLWVCLLACWVVATAQANADLPLSSTSTHAEFFKAIELDDEPTVRRFLLTGINPNIETPEGVPAISFAMQSGAQQVVRTLFLSEKLDVNQADMNGDTPLMIAAIYNNSGWVNVLLSKGASFKTEGKWTALHYAAASNSVEAIKLLLNAGAPINAKSPNGTTPLMMAARENNEEAVRVLLLRGADASPANQSGFTAAGYSTKAKNSAMTQQILKSLRR